jgi:hypothetical protein
MSKDGKHERYVDLILDLLQSEKDMKYRINKNQFHNHDFLDGYAFGLTVAMNYIAGMKTDEI